LPRSTKSRALNEESGAVATLEREEDVTTATTDTVDVDDDDAPQFEFTSEAAPDDFQPDRRTPGRVRRPSFFDGILRDDSVFGQGWQRIPITSDEHKQAAVRELNRAKLHLNKIGAEMDPPLPEIGLDLDVSSDTDVFYRSRVAQKRERRSTNGDAEIAAQEELEFGDDVDEDDRDA
jgi:hypothetical protein